MNSRVNYPIKHATKQMEEEDIIDMECDGMKFCVSEFTQEVALYGLQMTVQAQNNHVIPGSFLIMLVIPGLISTLFRDKQQALIWSDLVYRYLGNALRENGALHPL